MSDAPAAPVEAVVTPVAVVKTEEATADAVMTPPDVVKAEDDSTEAADTLAVAPAAAAAADNKKQTEGKAAKKSSKFDPSVLPESEDHSAIQTQVCPVKRESRRI